LWDVYRNADYGEREPRLAHATRAGESNQARPAQQPGHLSQLGLSPDEARQLRR
jgi:hypothetical protein